MRKPLFILFFITGAIAFLSFTRQDEVVSADKLRKLYSLPPDQWPAPSVDAGVPWKELGLLPESPLEKHKDSLKHLIELGKTLFFDTRLSGSGKISCATCHQPELNWTDAKEKSLGHEGAVNKRNSTTIQNSWYYNRLFWDGRSTDLQDQAFAPINSESEMNSEMHEVMRKLSKVKGYKLLFKQAFGDEDIDPFRMTEAIAVFEKTVVSRKTKWDEFLEGNKRALNNEEIKGLHLFRTKARCMNCHHGPLFTDNGFHHNGFSGTDAGYYKVSHKGEDSGKLKTPSLRDVMKTGPWMHDGAEKSIASILDTYNNGPQSPGTDHLILPLGLSEKEKKQLLAFLNTISAPAAAFAKPVMPE
jgi:cytochrome c peroxidase